MADASIPNWASDRRTFIGVSVVTGAVLAAFLIVAALAAPNTLRGFVKTLSSPLLLVGLVLVALLVGGVRRIVLGPARKQSVPANALVVTYVLAALPLGVAALALGAAVTLALVLEWQARFDLVQSFLLLLFGFVVFSTTVKIVINGQMLSRHWFRP